jgi:hypothetical protein
MANAPTTTEKPAATSATAATKGEAQKPKAVVKGDPCVAVHRINGVIEPGTPFRPESPEQRKELVDLAAIRDLTEAEALLFERMEAAQADAEDALG